MVQPGGWTTQKAPIIIVEDRKHISWAKQSTANWHQTYLRQNKIQPDSKHNEKEEASVNEIKNWVKENFKLFWRTSKTKRLRNSNSI